MNRLLLKSPGYKTSVVHTLILVVMAFAFILDIVYPKVLFLEWKNSSFRTSWLYDFVFSPYISVFFAWLIYQTVIGLRSAHADIKRTLTLLCSAYLGLAITGSVDLLIMININRPNDFPIFIEFGILGMGIVGTFIFTDRMVALFSQKRSTLLKIDHINGALAINLPMRELGISAAEISKEIQNQVSILKKNTLSLAALKKFGGDAEVTRIENIRTGLERYTGGLLDFSSCSQLGYLTSTTLKTVIELSLEKIPSKTRIKISVSGKGSDLIWVDQIKLSRAIFETIKNSIEAKSENIAIRLNVGIGLTSICIEDDGHGCMPEIAGKIRLPFFTTRKHEAALGLGASIAEGIIRAHGGTMRFYSKARYCEKESGLIANILLPISDKISAGTKRNWEEFLIVTDQNELITEALLICENLGIKLSVVGINQIEKQFKNSAYWRDKLLILDESITDVQSSKWINGRGFNHNPVYTCDRNYMLRPLKVEKSPHDQQILCEETVLKILTRKNE